VERNVRLYGWYQVVASALFWLPIFVLYFTEHLTLGNVLRLEAIYYIAVVVMEVPSGYFSDVVGRRITLIISSIAFVGSYALFLGGGFTEQPFLLFAGGQVLLAAGFAFQSGTDTAFHFDSLHAIGRSAEYADREAKIARNASWSLAGSALVGGLVAGIGLHWAYTLNLVAAVWLVGIVLAMVETGGATAVTGRSEVAAFVGQLRRCLGYLRQRSLAWLFGFALLSYAMNHIPYEIYQPYIKALLAGKDLGGVDTTPLVAGMLTAATMVLRGIAAGWSVRLSDKMGLGRFLLFSYALQVVIIFACAAILHPLILLVLLARSVPTGLQKAPLSAAIVPRIDQSLRATFLSLNTLMGRLLFSSILIGISFIVGVEKMVDWPSVRSMAVAGGIIAGGGLVLLAVTVPMVRDGAIRERRSDGP
jgi:MFS family permease